MVNVQEDFRIRLDKALSIRNLKPADLARRTGLTEATISQYRNGYTKPKSDKLMIISTALGVSPAWLMGLDVPMVDDMIPVTQEAANMTPEEHQIVLAYRKADEIDKASVRRTLGIEKRDCDTLSISNNGKGA